MIIRQLGKIMRKHRVRGLRSRGLNLPDDCRIMGWPEWGSEPYLISIGRRVTIASGVMFITHDGGTWVFRDDERYRDVITYGRIVIHDDSFIGQGATILPGVEVGPRSVVAAGAVVTKSVPPNTVAGGVPARTITTVDKYAERALANTPKYDRQAYRRDKREVLEHLYPKPW